MFSSRALGSDHSLTDRGEHWVGAFQWVLGVLLLLTLLKITAPNSTKLFSALPCTGTGDKSHYPLGLLGAKALGTLSWDALEKMQNCPRFPSLPLHPTSSCPCPIAYFSTEFASLLVITAQPAPIELFLDSPSTLASGSGMQCCSISHV